MEYNAKNYTEQGGEKTVIGGVLEFGDDAQVKGIPITELIPAADADTLGGVTVGSGLDIAADGKVYFKINEVLIELYTDKKDETVEKQVEDVLDGRGIFYNKSEVWITEKRLYEVLYSFEVPDVSED